MYLMYRRVNTNFVGNFGLSLLSFPGVVRYIGPVDFAEGVWLGVELRSPRGKNDGSVRGKRYFSCKPSHGLLVRPNKVSVRGINGARLLSDSSGARSWDINIHACVWLFVYRVWLMCNMHGCAICMVVLWFVYLCTCCMQEMYTISENSSSLVLTCAGTKKKNMQVLCSVNMKEIIRYDL